MARLTSDFFVSAYLRRCNGAGAFAALRHRGSPEAGAILVIIDRLDGTATLYGPAPQAGYDTASPERKFARLHKEDALSREAIETRIGKEQKFDPDLWLIEVESRDGQHFLELV